MIRKLLLLFVCVCATVSAWAETSVSLSDGTLTITTTEAGTLSSQSFSDADKAATTIVLVGKFSSADLEAINRNHGFTSVTTVNMKNAEFPKQSNGNTTTYNLFHSLPATSDNMYGEKYVEGGTYYVSDNSSGSWEWSESTYNDGDQVQARYATLEEAPAPSGNDQKMVVGGTVYQPVHDWSSNPATHTWQEVGAGENNDWTQMAFGGWEGLETIILPDNFNVESGKNYNNFYGNNKSTLQRIERGDSYALISKPGDNYAADIYCADDDQANMKAIVGLDNYITQDANITYANPNDHDYITWNEETQVYDVHVTYAGSLKSKFEKLYNTVGANELEGKVFRFDSECTGFTAEDLQALAHANGPYVYVDLYNVAATEAVETAIRDALKGNDSGVNALANNQHYKGLLLPSNPQQIGTALIANTGSSSPVSDFIAYNNGSTTTAHIYNTSTASADAYEGKLTALKGLLDDHSEIAQNTSVYLISTNSKTPIANVEDIKGTSTTASIVHTYNNEMVNPDATNPTKPCIEVIPAVAGDYATLNEATNMRNTPDTEVLKFKGSINADDILAVNSFTQTHWDDATNSYVENDPKVYNGPRVLDLSEVPASQITKDLLDNLENPEIEYIILPAGMDAPVVGDYDDENLPNLKCVISSDDSSKSGDRVLNAYVKVAGSLAEARVLATGSGAGGDGIIPAAQGLTEVKLSGNLNTSDVSLSNGGGLTEEVSTITTLDLSGASFNPTSDMKLGNNGAGFNSSAVLKEVKLPTSMTEIPNECLYGIKSLTSLHIPYNYKKIGHQAFRDTNIDHITTEDASHVLIDNGEHTYTFSANIEEIGEPGHTEGTPTFPNTVRITDVYCLGAKAPKCYQATFPAELLAGNGGANAGPYCIDKYQGLGENEKCFAVLHFPSSESYTNATVKDGSYNEMVAHYTDPTRKYTKYDQTGAVDGNGNPLMWPDQGELYQTYSLAASGNIWADYPNPSYAGDDHHLEGFGTANGGPHDITEANATDPYKFRPDYTGWHEFVLTQATYVNPDEIIDEHDNIVRKYQEIGWYTFCIPFDMTVSQVQRLLGVPASDPDNYIVSQLYNADGTLKSDNVENALMPEIRQLTKVTRKAGTGTENNQVRFILTRNLYNEGAPLYLTFDQTQADASVQSRVPTNSAVTTPNTEDPICLVGGHPYLIKAYKRYNPENANEYKITGQNLGMYILTKYADEFNKDASCLNHADCMEQLGDATTALATLQFARPYEDHKVQAMNDSPNAEYLTYAEESTTKSATDEKRYNYTLIGQFWQQELPQYCIYMSRGSWYRYTVDKSYTWDPYKCVIMATPEMDDVTDEDVPTETTVPEEVLPNIETTPANLKPHLGGKFRDLRVTQIPIVQPGTKDLLKADFKIKFKPGRNDDDFKKPGPAHAAPKYIFAFEDGISEFDENGNEVTAIKNLDGEDIETMFATGKVYNMNGQYVGTSLDGLSKGMYIMNGKKYVVK